MFANNEKIIGYTLLAIGLIIIATATVNVYMVFNTQASPVQLFNFPPVELDLSSMLPAGLGAAGQAKSELLPASVLNQTANVAAHLFLMGFIVSAGFRVASLGIQLARTIEVKIRGEQQKQGVSKS